METHDRTGKLANTFLCFKEVMSTKHIRGPCQLHEPSRLQPKEVRNNLVTPGNNPKGLEPRQRCSRCPAALQTFKRCLSQTGVVLAAWMPKETRWAKITQVTLVCFLICLYMCFYSPYIGREDPGLSRYWGAEKAGIKAPVVVFKEAGEAVPADIGLGEAQKCPAPWAGDCCRWHSSAAVLPVHPAHHWNSIFQPQMPVFSEPILCGCVVPLEEC